MLERAQIVSSTVKDSMHINRLSLIGVEDKIVLNNEVTIAEVGKVLFFRNSTHVHISGEKLEAVFDLRGKRFSGRWSISCNIRDNLCEVVFRNPKRSNVVLRPTHGCASGDPS